MRLGLFLSAHFEPGADVRSGRDGIMEQVAVAEDIGLDSVFLGHHYLARSAFMQPIPLASYLAARTERLRLGFGVYLLPLANPVALAEEIATLDVLSEGRLIAGFGTGYRHAEYEALGVPYDERYRRLEEYLPVLRRLWAGDEVDHDGTFGRLEAARLHLRPVQDGGPEVWLGAFGPIGIRRAARLGASWLAAPEGTADDLLERFALYRDALDEAGHSRERAYPLMREAFVAPTREQALRMAGPHLAAQYEQYRAWEHGTGDDLLDSHALVGTPDDIVRRLQEYRDTLGVTDVVMRMQWAGMDTAPVLESLRLLGHDVVPALQ